MFQSANKKMAGSFGICGVCHDYTVIILNLLMSFQIYCCLGTLSILNKLHLVNADMLGWWLCERQLPSGGLNGMNHYLKIFSGEQCTSCLMLTEK